MNCGQIINNKYEILSLIGIGGVEEVYYARDIFTNMSVVVKELKKNYKKQDTAIYQSMLVEAQMISKLHHNSIPRIFDIIDKQNRLLIIIEYIDGVSLDKLIQKNGSLPEEFVINLAKQLINVFKYIHSKNIIYGDLKPSNIMLQPNNEIMLIDFGIARIFAPEKSDDTTNLGTKGFAAPEQYGGRGQTDYRADIYAYGVTLFNMLTGINPANNYIESFAIRKYNSKLSRAIEYIIQKCTKFNRIDRYQSFEEIEYDFVNIFTLEKTLKRKYFIRSIFKIKHKDDSLNLLSKSQNSYIDPYKTTVLSGDNVDDCVPPSVLDNQKISIFLSYCHHDSDLADIICYRLDNYKFITISRYTTSVPYKNSFREFMNSLGTHDRVIMIISDQYLKSRACMYEVGKFITTPNFENKILFIVCSNEDKKFYKSPTDENIEAKIYDPHERNKYIIYWETQCKILNEDLAKIEDECAKIETLEIIRDIKQIISTDIGLFMKYLADVKGVSFSSLYQHDFSDFFKELGIEQRL